MTATPAEIARRALAAHLAALPPGQLLTRYATARDPEAFAGLVHQFGPLVLGTCRRVLGPAPDADDAFQAVFLALARHAGSFRDATALPAWLHRVSLRIGRKALARRTPTATLPEAVADPADPFAAVAWKDVRRVLDEEIDGLSEKLRGPVVLCWLDGLTQDEAAAKLGLSLTTLKRRLDAGRDLLRSRLLRRGLAPVLAAAATLPADALRAEVSSGLLSDVLRAAATVKPAAGVSRLAVLMALAAAAAGGVAVVSVMRPRPEAAPEPQAVAPPQPADEPPPDEQPPPPAAVARFGSLEFRVPDPGAAFAATPDGKLLAVTTGGGVQVREAATWKLVRTLSDRDGESVDRYDHRLAFSPDGRLLAWKKDRYSVYLWDVATGKQLHRFRREGQEVWGAIFLTRDGHLAMTDNSTPQRLRFFDTATGREVRVVTLPHSASVADLSPDGRVFVGIIGQGTGQLHPRALYDAETGKELLAFEAVRPWNGNQAGVAFSPAGKQLALVAADWSELQVWDVASRTVTKRLEISRHKRIPVIPVYHGTGMGRWPEDAYRQLQRPSFFGYGPGFTPDGRELWMGTAKGDLRRWDAATFAELPRVESGPGPSMLVPTDGGRMLLGTSNSGWVRIFDPATGKERPIPGRYGHHSMLAASPDGKVVAISNMGGRIDLLDATTGNLVRTLREKGDPVQRLVFSPDSGLLAVSEGRSSFPFDPDQRTSRVRVLRVPDGAEVWSLEKEPGEPGWGLSPLGFAAGGPHVIVSHDVDDVSVWDAATGKELRRLSLSGVPSPDGKLLAADDYGDFVLIDLATGREVKRVEIDPDENKKREKRHRAGFAWSADGTTLAALPGPHVCLLDSATGAVRKIDLAFDAAAAAQVESLQKQGFPLAGFPALSPDGKRLAAAVLNGRYVAVWDTETGRQMARMDHDFEVNSVAFTPDGKAVITFGTTGLGYRWDIEKLAAAQQKK